MSVILRRVSKRKLAIAVPMLLAFGVAAWFVLYVAQFMTELRSMALCEDDGIEWWRAILVKYAEEHNGNLPDTTKRAALAVAFQREAGHFGLACDTGAPYQWNPTVTHIDKQNPVPVAWCGRPHGVTRRWRNVLYSDLQLRHVPEVKFAAWPRRYLPGR